MGVFKLGVSYYHSEIEAIAQLTQAGALEDARSLVSVAWYRSHVSQYRVVAQKLKLVRPHRNVPHQSD